jgi:hypothetical protein
MASYTDKIPTFNPYVEQQPVDAMLKVGVYKQQKYEEGVKKIQTNIDNVAGLDIANDVQQKYLQSKLNALGNNLTFFAASDFSDFSLVNSVNGMTKQITKDEDIINAVSSTAKLRAGYKKKAELAKKGLTDKNNDDYYDMFASEYVDSKDLKASFNADYVPYTNIVKKLQQALVGAGESTTIAEQIFVTDPNTGKPLITNGKYTYADAKAIDKLVTNKPAVMAAINNVLNEGSVKQQLGIDGWATYRNTEATELLGPLKNDYDSERSRLEQQSVEITAMLNSTNISPEERELYTKASAEVEAALLKNDNTFMSLSKEAEDNPESFKQSYYTQEFKQRLMNQFLKEENSRTYGKNEALEAQMAKDKFAFEKQQEANKIAYQNEMLKIAQDGNMRAWYEFDGTYELDPVTGHYNKKPEPGKKGTGGTYDANKPLFSGGVPGDKVNAQNIIETDINFLNEQKNEMAKSLYVDFIRTNKGNANLSEEAILAQAKTYAKQLGVSTEVFLDRWAKNIKNKYDENDLTPPPNIDEEFNAYNNTATSLNNKMNQTKSLMDASIKEAGVEKELNDLLKGKATLNFAIKDQKFSITPKDMLDLKQSGWIERLGLGYGHAGKNRNNLLINEKNLTTNQNKFLSNWYNLSYEMQQQVYKEMKKYDGATKYYGAKEKAEKIYNEKLSKIVGVTDVVTGYLPMDTEGKPETISKVATYVNSGGERNYESGSDKQKVLDALDNATAVIWRGKKPTNSREEWTGEIVIAGPKGTAPVTITNVNRKDLETFTDATFTGYEEKPIQDALNINDKTKSTNPVHMVNSPNAWKTAYFNGAQVNPEVTRQGWAYRADVVKSGGGYRLVNYVRAPKTKNFVTIYGAAITPEENIIDNTYKTTTPVQLSSMYLNYLQKQNKQ